MSEFLLEIGTEEIPARFLPTARAHLRKSAQTDIAAWGIDCGDIEVVGTPRRITLITEGLSDKQQDFEETVTGPPWDRAFQEGEPTKAAIGFAKKQGIEPTALEKIETKRGFFAGFTAQRKGKTTQSLLADVIPTWIDGLPFGKNMRWESTGVRFARPLRWLVALYNDEILPFEFAGLKTDRVSYGHRFFGERFVVDSPSHYKKELARQTVMLNPDERRQTIVEQGHKLADAKKLTIDWDDDLLDEVVDLVEWPTALLGTFAATYLELPDMVLEAPMKKHQKYFPMRDQRGRMASQFLIISNQPSDPEGKIVAGNQRVLSARLADAKFFWDQDRAKSLEKHSEVLGKIVWQEGLGTLENLKERVKALALEVQGWFSANQKNIEAAADLYLADLGTQMVFEFADLQGEIGAVYAKVSGHNESVVQAIREAHLPKNNDSPLPKSGAGLALSLAHRIDLIVGNLIAGHDVTGSQDPYGMRRAAIGVFRMFTNIETKATPAQLCMDLLKHYKKATYLDVNIPENIAEKVQAFWETRLTAWLENQDTDSGTARSVATASRGHVNGAIVRLDALREYFKDANKKEKFLDTYKRLRNISRNHDPVQNYDHETWPDKETSFFAESITSAQASLDKALTSAIKASVPPDMTSDESSKRVMSTLEPLIAATEQLLEDVTINSDDEDLSDRRKGLVKVAQQTFDTIADFDLLISGETS